MALYNRAMNDILGKKKPLLDDNTANTTINRYFMNMQEAKSKEAIEAGQKFLATNKLRPEIKTTASGLQYEILTGRHRRKDVCHRYFCMPLQGNAD